jgi:phosphotransferase system enzyme I (PtsI)
MIILHGQGVSRGVAFGKLHFYHRTTINLEKRSVENAEAEVKRFETARGQAIAQLAELYTETKAKLGEENSLLFQIHQMMLEDLDYCSAVTDLIREEKVCAEYAVSRTAEQFAGNFSNMDDEYMKGRAADVKDVSNRVITILTGAEASGYLGDKPFVLAAEDLAPSETAQLDQQKVLAIVTSSGSANSHTAIFARTMGIPAVIGLGDRLENHLEGREIILDGETGSIYVEPEEEIIRKLRLKHDETNRQEQLLERYRGQETRTADGQKISLYANIGNLSDADAAIKNDAEGIGLFRSEFLYLERNAYPAEEEQFAVYKVVAQKMQGKRVIIRTLDIGADKQANYFGLPQEDNPAMGMRAIRICLTRPNIFKVQLRALYRASFYGKIAIMFPMITSVEEVQKIKEICSEVRRELEKDHIPFNSDVELGIMIETPAAAIISDELAQEVDFFSIGTNDLTQYTLAMDRQNRNLEQFCNTHHKAILRLIQSVAENAHNAGIWVGICGELGADESLIEMFVRMGIDELSVTASAILRLRASISEIDAKKDIN